MLESILDWVSREGGVVLTWWLLATLAGAAAWPLTFRLLRGLPDRGYTLVRLLGMVLIGYVFWMATSLGLVMNTNGSVILAAVVVLALGILIRSREESPLRWLRENWKLVLLTEVLFVILFLGWALFRAANPALTGTEKPMEIAFTSAIRRSETFPPNDPWMSGYAISYYYFGYVMAAALANLSGVTSGMAFNLMIALLFALTGIGVFGVVYNIVRARVWRIRRRETGEPTPRKIAVAFGVLGMLFAVLLGNLETVLIEVPYQSGTASAGYLAFWDIEERDVPRPSPAEDVDGWNFWWWFRASRVIRDRDLSGAPSGVQPIDEFPAFSFVLADMHPHVLALPFAAMALGLALNLLLSDHDPTRREILLYGVCLGGLVFLNTWDGPIYMGVLVGADALRRLLRNGTGRLTRQDGWALVRLGLWMVVLTLVLYAPFFIGFRSQLGGVLPNVIHPTRIHQFFVMFGPFLLILAFFLGVEAWRGWDELNWSLALKVLLLALLALLLAMVVLGVVAWLRPEVRGVVYSVVETAGGLLLLSGDLLRLRVVGLPLLVLLGGMIAVVIARLFTHPRIDLDDRPPYAPSTGFALLLVGVGAVLALVPDFLYLRDNFGVRINTVFKFYYQTWLVWSVASAYAAYTILADVDWAIRPASAVRVIFAGVLVVILIAGLAYPVLAIYSRAIVETGRAGGSVVALTLDGESSLVPPDDHAAIRCLNQLVKGDDAVVAEAVGPAYRHQFGRVAGLTGIPTVIGWENHERQWRGATYDAVAGTRAQDIERLYNDLSWPAVQEIVDRYGIDYIFVGSTEMQTYDTLGLSKFAENLTPVCQSGDVVVYQVPSG